jgi:hypothetical protein
MKCDFDFVLLKDSVFALPSQTIYSFFVYVTDVVAGASTTQCGCEYK